MCLFLVWFLFIFFYMSYICLTCFNKIWPKGVYSIVGYDWYNNHLLTDVIQLYDKQFEKSNCQYSLSNVTIARVCSCVHLFSSFGFVHHIYQKNIIAFITKTCIKAIKILLIYVIKAAGFKRKCSFHRSIFLLLIVMGEGVKSLRISIIWKYKVSSDIFYNIQQSIT